MRHHLIAWPLVACLLAACDALPTEPLGTTAPPDAATPLAAGPAGFATLPAVPAAIEELLAGSFTFLHPLPVREAVGEFDGSVLPVLAVHVCQLPDCDPPALVAYTSSSGPGSETVRLDEEDQLFIVNWRPGDLGLPSPAAFRVRVLAAGLVLGHVDVQLVSNGSDLKRADTGETLALQDRRTLPVKFSVRENRVISAWLQARSGAEAAEVAELLVTEFGSDSAETAMILAFLGYGPGDVAGVMKDIFQMGPEEVIALFLSLGLIADGEDATDVLGAAGYTIAEIVAVLRDVFDLAAGEIVPLLTSAGAAPFDIAQAIVDELNETLETAASLLKDSGFEPELVFDALVRVGELAGDPLGTAIGAGMAIMTGLGYAFDDFKNGLQGYLKENVTDVLEGMGLSGLSIGELADFMLNVMELTVDMLMDRAESWGVPLSDVVDALMDAGAAIDDIVAGAIAAYDATAEAIGQALADAGAAALELGGAIMDAFDQTIDEMAALLKDIGYQGEVVFDAVLQQLLAIANDPADFPIALAMAVMKGAGFAFDDFKGALQAYLQDNFIDVLEGLGLSGFSIGELASFMLDVMGLTVQRVAELAERWGVPVPDLIAALADAGAVMDEIVAWTVAAYDLTAAQLAAAMLAAGQEVEAFADAMIDVFDLTAEAAVGLLKDAGYLAADVGDWLFDRFAFMGEAGFQLAASMLTAAGYAFDKVANWVWARANAVPGVAAKVLRGAGYSARAVADYIFNVAKSTARTTFGALKTAGYTAAETADAVRLAAGASFVAIGGWLLEFYDLAAASTIAILQDLGASLTDLVVVLLDSYSAGLDELTALLLSFDYTLAQILEALP
jgi:hypothetical protein